MGVEEIMKFVMEKLKEALLAMKNVFPPETWREKISQWLLALENSGGEALAWFDKVFPPETRAEKIKLWIHVALPYLIAAVVLTVVVWLCRRCCGCLSRGTVKMMKAPGRNIMIPRSLFVSDPKAYFTNLRLHPGDNFC